MADQFKLDDGFEEINLDDGFEEVSLDDGFEEVPDIQADLQQKAYEAQGQFEAPKADEFIPEVTPLEEGKMGALEAAAVHAAPSMTLGASDVLAGVSGAAGHAVGSLAEGEGIPKYEDLLDTYYEAKKGEGKRRDKAMDDQPAASIAGMVGGGFLTPIPAAGAAKMLSKAGKVGKLAAKVLPNTKGFSEAARAKKMASNVKDMQDMYKYYKTLKKAAVGKAALAGITEGAKAGAIMSGTMGEAELLKGELAKTAKEVAEGAVSGGTVGGLFSGGTALSGAALEAFPGVKTVVKSFKTGQEGHELSKEYIQNNTRRLTKSFINDMNKRFSKLGMDRKEVTQAAKDLGKMVHTEDDVMEAIQHFEQFKDTPLAKKAGDYLESLKVHLGKSKEMTKIQDLLVKKQAQMNQMDLGLDEVAAKKLAKQQIGEVLRTKQRPASVTEGNIAGKDIIDTPFDISTRVQQRDMPSGKTALKSTDVTPKAGQIRTGIDPETGLEFGAIKDMGTGKETIKVAGKPLAGLVEGQATIDQATSLKKQIQDYTFLKAGADVPEEVKSSATKLIKQLSKRIDDAVEGGDVNISDINKKFSKLYNTFEAAKVTAKPVGSLQKGKQLQEMANFITDAGDDASFTNIEIFLKELSEGAPDIAEKHGNEIAKMRELVELSKGTEYIPLGANKLMTSLMGTIGGAINRGANLAGRAASNISKGGNVGHATRRMIESSPEKMQKIIAKMEASGNALYKGYVAPLQKAMQEEGRTRAAIMFGLMQRPDFRNMVIDLDEEE